MYLRTSLHSRILSKFAAGFSLAAVGAILPSAHAASTWTGSVDKDWNNTSNWNVDPSGQDVIINTATGNHPIISSDSWFTPVDIRVGAGSNGRLDHISGSVATGTGNWFMIGYTGATATYNLANTAATGGTFTGFGQGSGSLTTTRLIMGLDTGTTSVVNMNTSGTLTVTDSVYVGGTGTVNSTFNLDNGTVNITNNLEVAGRQYGQTSGTGLFRMSGGTVNVGGVTYVAPADNNAGVQNGTLTVAGGTLNSAGDLIIGFAGSSSANGTLNISGGAVNVGTATKRWMIVSQWDTVNSNVNISSGSLNLNAGTDLRFSTGNNSGTNTVTLSGGSITSFSGNLTGDGAGVVDLNQGSGAPNNTFNLNGGTLAIFGVVTNSNNGTAAFNLNGGTLKATGSNANFIDLGGAAQRANVRNGGAVINTNGYNVTVVEALQHSNIGGDNATDGGLTKNGAGTLTLAGANTYTGATTINNGVLALSGSIASSTLGFNLTNSTAGQLSILNPSFTFSGTLALGLAAVTASNNWTLFSGGEFDAGDFNALSAVTSDLGNFSNLGGGQWSLSSVSGSWSFNDNTGALTFTAVPEPHEYALGIAGVLVLIAGSRLRRRQLA